MTTPEPHDMFFGAALRVERERLVVLERISRTAEQAHIRLANINHQHGRVVVTDVDGRLVAAIVSVIDLSQQPPRIEITVRVRDDLRAIWDTEN